MKRILTMIWLTNKLSKIIQMMKMGMEVKNSLKTRILMKHCMTDWWKALIKYGQTSSSMKVLLTIITLTQLWSRLHSIKAYMMVNPMKLRQIQFSSRQTTFRIFLSKSKIMKWMKTNGMLQKILLLIHQLLIFCTMSSIR